MQNLKVGDRVTVMDIPLYLFANKDLDVSAFPKRSGTIEFVSDNWATVLVESQTTRKPIYRKAFWEECISLERKRR